MDMIKMAAKVFGKVGTTKAGRSQSCGLPSVDTLYVGSISREEVGQSSSVRLLSWWVLTCGRRSISS